MDHPPAYAEFANKEKPEVHWKLPGENWVGFYGHEWCDLIGNEIIKQVPEISYEVWQPDLNADRIYSHTFHTGLTHSLFPATLKSKISGLKRTNQVYSQAIINTLLEVTEKKLNKDNIIIECGFGATKFYKQILKFKKYLPIVSQYTGHPYNITALNRTFNPVKLIHRGLSLFERLRMVLMSDFLIIGDYLQKESILLKLLLPGRVFHTMIGIEETFFDRPDKSASRKALKIPEDCFVMFSSSRLVFPKQIDRLIECCNRLDHKYLLIISGHGTKEYESYLFKMVIKYNLTDKIHFIGYVSEQELLQYYSATDLFITTCLREGGPISAWKALAMGIPVFISNTGNVANFLKEQSAGCVVGVHEYNQWSNLLNKIILGEIAIKSPEIKHIHDLVSWNNCTRKYLAVYKEILEIHSMHKKRIKIKMKNAI